MNEKIAGMYPWAKNTQAMRDQVLNTLSDADLAYTPGGDAMKLGELFREWGEIEHAYIESFTQFTQTFSYRTDKPEVANSVAALGAWLKSLDEQLEAALEAVEDSEKIIKREGGFETTVFVQLDIYLQALLIFMAKLSVYFRIMKRPLPGEISSWIG